MAPESQKLSGRVALVTGGSRGIGRAIAEGLLAAGASVVITGRTQAHLDEAIPEFAERDKEAKGYVRLV